MANGSNMAAMLLTYVVTLFGSWLLYDQVMDNGCATSCTVDESERCDPAGVDGFSALFGVSFGAAVVPQTSTPIESIMEDRVACYPTFAVIQRRKSVDGANNRNQT